MVALTKIRAQNIKLKEKLAGLRPASPIIKTPFLILGRAEGKGTCVMGSTQCLQGFISLPADKAWRAPPVQLIFQAPPPSNLLPPPLPNTQAGPVPTLRAQGS